MNGDGSDLPIGSTGPESEARQKSSGPEAGGAVTGDAQSGDAASEDAAPQGDDDIDVADLP